MPDDTAQIETADAPTSGFSIFKDLTAALPVYTNGHGPSGDVTNGSHHEVGSILSDPLPALPVGLQVPIRAPFVPDARLGVVDKSLPITSNMAAGSSMTIFDDEEGEDAMRASVPSNHPASRAEPAVPARSGR